MPFTVSHIAAVLPLRRYLPALPLSAMAIGSMVPDFGFLVPGLDRHTSHSFAGLLTFCLPMGWLSQLLFWHILQTPLLNLAPRSLERRLQATLCSESRGLLCVSTALLVAAFTHIAWDGMTHLDGFIVARVSLLRLPLIMLGKRPLLMCDVLQHLSSVIGLLVLAMYISRWFCRTTPQEACAIQYRIFWLLLLILLPLGTGVMSLIAWLPSSDIEHIAAQAASRSLEAAAVCLLGYALWWHVRRSRIDR
jgi:hypothetical protein